jgi:hypothetical protein
LAALVVGIWLLSAYALSRPAALGLDAPATQFSAARADAALGRVLGDQRAHPSGSVEAQAVRARVLRELDRLNVHARSVTEMSCSRDHSTIICGTVNNIIADVSPGQGGKTILLMAHTDSVAAGPGAADDGSGVAILLETIRALKARGLTGQHPIITLFSDGEEPGLLGATAMLRDPAMRARIGAVINLEARGNQGPSYLFQTGPANSKLIDLYAHSVSHPATSSLYGEIYKYLPNDTDLTPMLGSGVPAYNFAFIGNPAQYHTPLDRRENLGPRSLQDQGGNMLAMADALSQADLAKLKGENAIYLDVLGRWLPRLAQRWALPLSLAVFAVIALAGLLTRRERRALSRPLLAALMPPLLLLGCVGAGYGLHGIAAWLSGHADPSFAHPFWLRLSLGFGVFAVALLAARFAGAAACWLWLAALAIACALFLPGATPFFLFPCLIAAPLLLVTVRGGRGVALLISALAALVIWIPFNQGTEALMGLGLHPIFTITAAIGLVVLLPLLGRVKHWRWSFAAASLLALALAVVAGLQPAYSIAEPQPLNLHYVERDGRAFWLADPVPHLPESLRAAANFSATPQRLLEMGYVAPAGVARNPVPGAQVTRNGDTVTLDLKASGDGVLLVVPAEAQLQALTIGGLATPAETGRTAILCVTPDCATAHMILHLASPDAVKLLLVAQRHGLPPDGAKLVKARPHDAAPISEGDSSMLAATIAIPKS